ncbi:MAG: sugar MFS transporter [Verrucomicrobia bacterium]|nr:sugar MFS transporter [Verrucomicrobiota bacterium]
MKSGLFRTNDGQNHFVTFALISSLFFLWALCNGMIDVMDKHFQELLHLNKRQSAWVQFAHYLGYFLMALPAGWLARRLGYKGGIISGLLLVALGCLWFIPATGIKEFWAFLAGVCVISMGLTFLETVANPYTTVLGAPQHAAVRINIAQICNGVGWILGPIIGGLFFYSKDGAEAAQETLWIPYAWIAGAVLVLSLVFAKAKIPDIESQDIYHLDDSTSNVSKSIWSHGHFSGAVIAQFLYVACQAGIFGFFIFYIVEDVQAIPESMKSSWLLGGESGSVIRDGQRFISEQGATKLLAYIGFALFLLGRFTGAGILRKISAHKVLGTYALANSILMVLIVLKLGWISLAALFLSFFFMSIMFPTIFALGIHGLGQKAKVASSFIVMAIMGGALMPKLMGHIGDLYSMSVGFSVPAVCFIVVALYGFFWQRLSGSDIAPTTNLRGGH